MRGGLDLIDIFLLIGAGLVVAIGIFAHTIWKERQMAKLLALASKRLGGQVVGKGLGHPELRLTHNGITGTLKFFSRRGRGDHSLLVFNLPRSSPFSLHLLAPGATPVLDEAFGGEPVKLPDPRIAQFRARASDPSRAQLMLNADAAAALARLAGLHPQGHLELLVHGRDLAIGVPTYLRQADQVLGMGFMGQKLLDRFLASSGYGGAVAAEPGVQPPCAVCNKPIQATRRGCTYCDASWHADCATTVDSCPACGAPTTGARTD